MKKRSGVLTAIICVLFLLGGTVTASASGFEDIDLDIDTHARVDFGFGETNYRAIATIPARVRESDHMVQQTWFMEGVRYMNVDSSDGPEYFDILGGTVMIMGVGDLDDPTKGHGGGVWHFEIETDDGIQYKSNGMILDHNRTPENRDVWHWNGPIIEP